MRETLSIHYFLRSAYLLYYYDIYLKVQQELPHLPQSEINKKISESWRLLSVAERSYYLEKAKLEKEGLDPVSNFFPNWFLHWFNGKGLGEINLCSPVSFSWENFELSHFSFFCLILPALLLTIDTMYSFVLGLQQYMEMAFSELSAVSLGSFSEF